ncbi:Hydroxymethylglutaryl-CoA lyase, mitochondrial [Hondaea fermentalgiana]|uniref:hydroxymethylglutaryl-CoA lyase n=1 Tax=Hondaea fermentalgiana TaxID=2315210 RepID=A0A2R5GSI2_9STRA|nr:Hydroxymethylglutaryl-CoA lyase, mitochondrial [Hondaea fermentalgiana]|eukprot:GBG33269.1 Hydroxymethylglutaryl-CoA lyase, mitochondrial [Hondaea fermentalgiana]
MLAAAAAATTTRNARAAQRLAGLGAAAKRPREGRRLAGAAARAFSSAGFPEHVRIVEVGPRDGLQNEKTIIPTDVKVEFIDRLSRTGLQTVEATSFVSPDYVPQMGDHRQVMERISRQEGVSYPVLTPNMKGFLGALESKAEEVAVFAAASEAFSKKNLNCTIEKSLDRFKPVCEEAQRQGIRVRGYVSCVLGCPYEGYIAPAKVVEVCERLIDLGCYEVSLGDTIGIGTAGSTQVLLTEVLKHVPREKVAVHFHDTYGQALANIFVALQNGISVVDSSVGGLGGCPFAKGATGNVATEDVVYMLHGLGISTGIDLEQLAEVGDYISQYLGRANHARAGRAMLTKGQFAPLVAP